MCGVANILSCSKVNHLIALRRSIAAAAQFGNLTENCIKLPPFPPQSPLPARRQLVYETTKPTHIELFLPASA